MTQYRAMALGYLPEDQNGGAMAMTLPYTGEVPLDHICLEVRGRFSSVFSVKFGVSTQEEKMVLFLAEIFNTVVCKAHEEGVAKAQEEIRKALGLGD